MRKEQKISGEELFFETLAKLKGKITMKDWDKIHKERGAIDFQKEMLPLLVVLKIFS